MLGWPGLDSSSGLEAELIWFKIKFWSVLELLVLLLRFSPQQTIAVTKPDNLIYTYLKYGPIPNMYILLKQTFSIIKEEISHCLFQPFQSCFFSNAYLSL